MEIKTDKASEIFSNLASRAFAEAIAEHCTSRLETVCTPAMSESLPAADEAVWFCLNLEGSLQGRVYFAVKQQDLPALGMRDAAAKSEAETAALFRLLQTMATRLREHAMSRYVINAAVEQVMGPASLQGSAFQISARSAEGDRRATLWLCLEPRLVSGLQASAGELFPEAAPVPQLSAENLDLVLDVELNATLRFGQRQLSLREILELTNGSVVELDRQVDEPVELILDGRVIARGEAVIIDGNYGMRITEILQAVNAIARSR